MTWTGSSGIPRRWVRTSVSVQRSCCAGFGSALHRAVYFIMDRGSGTRASPCRGGRCRVCGVRMGNRSGGPRRCWPTPLPAALPTVTPPGASRSIWLGASASRRTMQSPVTRTSSTICGRRATCRRISMCSTAGCPTSSSVRVYAACSRVAWTGWWATPCRWAGTAIPNAGSVRPGPSAAATCSCCRAIRRWACACPWTR